MRVAHVEPRLERERKRVRSVQESGVGVSGNDRERGQLRHLPKEVESSATGRYRRILPSSDARS